MPLFTSGVLDLGLKNLVLFTSVTETKLRTRLVIQSHGVKSEYTRIAADCNGPT